MDFFKRLRGKDSAPPKAAPEIYRPPGPEQSAGGDMDEMSMFVGMDVGTPTVDPTPVSTGSSFKFVEQPPAPAPQTAPSSFSFVQQTVSVPEPEPVSTGFSFVSQPAEPPAQVPLDQPSGFSFVSSTPSEEPSNATVDDSVSSPAYSHDSRSESVSEYSSPSIAPPIGGVRKKKLAAVRPGYASQEVAKQMGVDPPPGSISSPAPQSQAYSTPVTTPVQQPATTPTTVSSQQQASTTSTSPSAFPKIPPTVTSTVSSTGQSAFPQSVTPATQSPVKAGGAWPGGVSVTSRISTQPSSQTSSMGDSLDLGGLTIRVKPKQPVPGTISMASASPTTGEAVLNKQLDSASKQEGTKPVESEEVQQQHAAPKPVEQPKPVEVSKPAVVERPVDSVPPTHAITAAPRASPQPVPVKAVSPVVEVPKGLPIDDLRALEKLLDDCVQTIQRDASDGESERDGSNVQSIIDLVAKIRGEVDQRRQALGSERSKIIDIQQEKSRAISVARASIEDLRVQQETAIQDEEFELAEQLNDRIAQLTSEMDANASVVAAYDEDLKASEEKERAVDELEMEICDLTAGKIKHVEMLQNAQLQAYVTSANARIARKRDEMGHIEDNILRTKSHISLDMELLNKQQFELDSLIAERTKDIHTEAHTWTAKLKGINAEIEKIKAQLREKERLADECHSALKLAEERIEQEKAHHSKAFERLAADRSHIASEQAKCEAEEQAVVAARLQLEKDRERIAQRQKGGSAALDRLSSAAHEVTNRSRRLVRAKQRRADARAELSRIEAQLRSLREDVEAAERELAEHQNVMMSLRSDANHHHEIAASLRAAVAAIELRMPDLMAEKKVAVDARNFKEAGRITKEIKDQTTAIEETKARAEAAAAAVTQAQSDLELAKTICEEATAVRDEKRRAVDLAVIQQIRCKIREVKAASFAVGPELFASELRSLQTQLHELRQRHSLLDDASYDEPADEVDEPEPETEAVVESQPEAEPVHEAQTDDTSAVTSTEQAAPMADETAQEQEPSSDAPLFEGMTFVSDEPASEEVAPVEQVPTDSTVEDEAVATTPVLSYEEFAAQKQSFEARIAETRDLIAKLEAQLEVEIENEDFEACDRLNEEIAELQADPSGAALEQLLAAYPLFAMGVVQEEEQPSTENAVESSEQAVDHVQQPAEDTATDVQEESSTVEPSSAPVEDGVEDSQAVEEGSGVAEDAVETPSGKAGRRRKGGKR